MEACMPGTYYEGHRDAPFADVSDFLPLESYNSSKVAVCQARCHEGAAQELSSRIPPLCKVE